jgi:HSP20 family protein
MTIVRRPSPFGELVSLRQAMDRLFEDSFVRPRQWASGVLTEGILPLDVRTEENDVVIEAALPGVRPEDVDITVENGVLTISGQTASETEEREGGYLLQEIRRGSFSRTVSLPEGLEADKAEARFENGMLELRIPRAEQVKPRQIRITPTSDGQASKVGSTTSGATTPSTAAGSTGSPDTEQQG